MRLQLAIDVSDLDEAIARALNAPQFLINEGRY